MKRLTKNGRRLARIALAAACLALLALPAAASSRSRDRDHDKMPDRWERKHRLNPHNKRDAKKDNDRDGLRNLAEYRSHTNPRDGDSDNDGVGDADEDRDRDRVDNGNEVREHTRPDDPDTDNDRVRDGREDADTDDLNNAGEDESGNDPTDPDTDDDGVQDGDEHAGEIVSREGDVLTIRVFGGGTVSGRVGDFTEVKCKDEDELEDGGLSEDGDHGDDVGEDGDDGESEHGEDGDDGESEHGEDGPGEGGSGEGGSGEGGEHGFERVNAAHHPEGDDEEGDDEGDDESACSVEDLVEGAVVHEAELKLTGEGPVFTEVELVS